MSLQMSTRSRYGVRLMVALALRYGDGISLLREISRQEGISEKYLGQIIIPLKAAGLVLSQRGAHGGYSLARPPGDITVRDVVEAIEGSIAPVPCVDPAAGASVGECGENPTAANGPRCAWPPVSGRSSATTSYAPSPPSRWPPSRRTRGSWASRRGTT